MHSLLLKIVFISLVIFNINSQYYSELWKKDVNEDVVNFLENKEYSLVFSSNGLITKYNKFNKDQSSSKLLNHKIDNENYKYLSNERCKYNY